MKIDEFDAMKDRFKFDGGINGKGEYFNSVILLLIIPIDGEYHLVFQKRASHIRQGGEISFPGGRIEEEDLSLEQVALRETKEEMGISEDKIRILGRLNTVVTPAGVTVDAYVGIADIIQEEIQINPCEVEAYFTIPISYFIDNKPDRYGAQVTIHPSYIDKDTGEEVILFPAKKLGLPEKYSKPWGDFRYGILVYPTDYGVIWGITARLIFDFIEMLGTSNNSFFGRTI